MIRVNDGNGEQVRVQNADFDDCTGDDDTYRKGHSDGVREVIDYMIREVGYCNFGE